MNAFKGLVEFERETMKFSLSLYTTQSIKSFIALTPLFVALKNWTLKWNGIGEDLLSEKYSPVRHVYFKSWIGFMCRHMGQSIQEWIK